VILDQLGQVEYFPLVSRVVYLGGDTGLGGRIIGLWTADYYLILYLGDTGSGGVDRILASGQQIIILLHTWVVLDLQGQVEHWLLDSRSSADFRQGQNRTPA
jgi:hypothetical protein